MLSSAGQFGWTGSLPLMASSVSHLAVAPLVSLGLVSWCREWVGRGSNYVARERIRVGIGALRLMSGWAVGSYQQQGCCQYPRHHTQPCHASLKPPCNFFGMEEDRIGHRECHRFKHLENIYAQNYHYLCTRIGKMSRASVQRKQKAEIICCH